MRQWLLLAIFVILNTLYLIRPPSISADSKFTTSFDLTYKVAETGITNVNQNFTIINRTSDFFPQEYVTRIGKTEIGNIKAFDNTGQLPVTLEGDKDNRQIHVKFNQKTAGFGQTLSWVLSYDTPEIAKKRGQIWEIFIPRPSTLEETTNYTIGLYVPSTFPKPFVAKPRPQNSDHIWNSNEVNAGGIYSAYDLSGEEKTHQIFDFTLRYHLHNTRLYPAQQEIALPPDTNSQKVYLQTLVPQPVNVHPDSDGNWLAQYSLGPTASLNILATGSAAVYFLPNFSDKTQNLNDYTKPKHYWEASDPKIKQLAEKYKTPKEIYDYVVSTLNYNFSRSQSNIERLGAASALISPDNSICLEFTDLFIAIARAAGIPAREVDGFALPFNSTIQPTKINRDALHSWPEYFDPAVAGWRMVDPTWEKTTGGIDYFHFLDTNHLAFVIKGNDSTSPSPAGTYKSKTTSANDVDISVHSGPLKLRNSPQISLRTNLAPSMASGFTANGKVYVENNGPTAYLPTKLDVFSNDVTISLPAPEITTIPPAGHLEIPFTVSGIPWNQSQNAIITVQLGNYTKNYPVTFLPVYHNKLLVTIATLTILGILSIFAQITRNLLFSR